MGYMCTTKSASPQRLTHDSDSRHLRRRPPPDVDPDRPPGLLLLFWTEVSLFALLALLGSALVFGNTSSITGIVFLLITSLRAAVGVLLLLAALVLLIANLRAYLGRR